MPNFNRRPEKANLQGRGFPGAALLASIPVFVIFYVLVVLPFLPDDGKGRVENILFWPSLAALTLTLVVWNWGRLNKKFFSSLPIIGLTGYLAFGLTSVTWAYSPDLSFSRIVVEVLACIIVVLPFALPIRAQSLIPGAHVCYAIAFAISAVYVLTTPPSPIGHPGYFSHKQELGCVVATGILLSCHELLHRGWRRILALLAIGVGAWLIVESQSKSALAYSFFSLAGSWLILMLCKKTRLTPAIIVAAIAVAFMFVSNPIERIGYRLYGDPTLTGRTEIWSYIHYQISLKPWLGWGFHSYYFVPNSPIKQAGGFVAQMPSSHSGFLDVRLETGRIGYSIFILFIYASLHVLERVRRVSMVRAWCYLSIELFAILIDLTDSYWFSLDPLSILYLIVVAESVRYPSIAAQRNRMAVVPGRTGPARRRMQEAQSQSYGHYAEDTKAAGTQG